MDFTKYFNNLDNEQDERKKARLASASSVIARSLAQGNEQFGWLDKHNEVYEKYGLERNAWEDLDSQLKDVQTGREKLGNSLVRTIGDLGFMTLEGFTNLPTLPADIVKYMMGGRHEYGNDVANWFHEKQDELDEAYKIYRDNKSILDGGLFDSSWYLDNMPSIMSSLALMIPGEAATRGAAWLGRGAKALGSKSLNSLTKALEAGTNTSSRLSRAAESIDKARRWNAEVQFGKGASYLGEIAMNAGTQRLLENTNEGRSVYNANYELALNEINDMTDEEFANFKAKNRIDPSTGRIDAAKYVAQKAYEEDFKDNLWNFFFDVAQVHAVKSLIGNGFRRATNPEIRAAQRDAVDKFLGRELTDAEKAFNASMRGKAINWAKTRDWNRIIFGEATEGVEEIVNYVAEQEGGHVAKVLLGKEDTSDFSERLGSYFHDGNLWDSAFWGFLGGLIYSNGHRLVNNKVKTGSWRDTTTAARIQAINNTSNSFNQFMNEINAITSSQEYKDNPESFNEVLDNLITEKLSDIALHAAQSGNLSFLEEFINNDEVKQKFLESSGLNENASFYTNFNNIVQKTAGLYEANLKQLRGIVSRYLDDPSETDVIMPQYIQMLATSNVKATLAGEEADKEIAKATERLKDILGDKTNTVLAFTGNVADKIALAYNRQIISDKIKQLEKRDKAGNEAMINRLRRQLNHLDSMVDTPVDKAFVELAKRNLFLVADGRYVPKINRITADDIIAIDSSITRDDAESYADDIDELQRIIANSIKDRNGDDAKIYKELRRIADLKIYKDLQNITKFDTLAKAKEALKELHLDTQKAIREEYRNRYNGFVDVLTKKAQERNDLLQDTENKPLQTELRRIMQEIVDGTPTDQITSNIFSNEEIKEINDAITKVQMLSIANNTLSNINDPVDDMGYLIAQLQNSDLLKADVVDTRQQPPTGNVTPVNPTTPTNPAPQPTPAPQPASSTPQPSTSPTFEEKFDHELPGIRFQLYPGTNKLIPADDSTLGLPMDLVQLNNGNYHMNPSIFLSTGQQLALDETYFNRELGFDARKELKVINPAEVAISSTGELQVVKKGEIGNVAPPQATVNTEEGDGETPPIRATRELDDEAKALKDLQILTPDDFNKESAFLPVDEDMRAADAFSSIIEEDRYITLLAERFNNAINAADNPDKVWHPNEFTAIFDESVEKIVDIAATEGKDANYIRSILIGRKADNISSIRIKFLKEGRFSRNTEDNSPMTPVPLSSSDISSLLATTDYARRLYMANPTDENKERIENTAKEVIETFIRSFPVEGIGTGVTDVDGVYYVRLSDIFSYSISNQTNPEYIFNIIVSAIEKFEVDGHKIKLIGETKNYKEIIAEAMPATSASNSQPSTISDFRINILDTVTKLSKKAKKEYWQNYGKIDSNTPIRVVPVGGSTTEFKVVASLPENKDFTLGTFAIPRVSEKGSYIQNVDGWIYDIKSVSGKITGPIVDFVNAIFDTSNTSLAELQKDLFKITYATITGPKAGGLTFTVDDRNALIDKILQNPEFVKMQKPIAEHITDNRQLIEHLVKIVKFMPRVTDYRQLGSPKFKNSIDGWFTKVYNDYNTAINVVSNPNVNLQITRRFKGKARRSIESKNDVTKVFYDKNKGYLQEVKVGVVTDKGKIRISGTAEEIAMPANSRLQTKGVPYIFVPRDDADADVAHLIGKAATLSGSHPLRKIVSESRKALNNAIKELYETTKASDTKKAIKNLQNLCIDIFGSTQEPSLFYSIRGKNNIVAPHSDGNGFTLFIPGSRPLFIQMHSNKLNVTTPMTDANGDNVLDSEGKVRYSKVSMSDAQDKLFHAFDNLIFGVSYKYIENDNKDIDKRKKTGIGHYTDDGKFEISIGDFSATYDSFSDFVIKSNAYKTDVYRVDGSIYDAEPTDSVINATVRIGYATPVTESSSNEPITPPATALYDSVKNILISDSENKAQEIVTKIIDDIIATDATYATAHIEQLNFIKYNAKDLFILPKNIIFANDENLKGIRASTDATRFNDTTVENAVYATMYSSETDNPICAVGENFLALLNNNRDSKLFAIEQLIHEQLHHAFKQDGNKEKVASLQEVFDEFKTKIADRNDVKDFIKNNIDKISLEEFVIQTITNSDWANALNNIQTDTPISKDSKETIWQKLVNLLCDLFGIKINKGHLYEKEFIMLGDILQDSKEPKSESVDIPGGLTTDEIEAALRKLNISDETNEDEDEDDVAPDSRVALTRYQPNSLNDLTASVDGLQTAEFSDLVERGELSTYCR